jgi:hypothetical protein
VSELAEPGDEDEREDEREGEREGDAARPDVAPAAAAETVAAPTGEDDPIERAWSETTTRWDDPKAHQIFVALCSSTGRLAEAGRRYREARKDPARAARADEQIERILGIAMQSLAATKSEPGVRNAKLRAFLVALGMMIAFGASAAWAFLRFR